MANREPAADRLLTAEEYALLEDDDRYRDELVRGRVVKEPGPGLPHGRVQLNLAAELRAFVKRRALGSVAVESAYIPERKPDTVRRPEVSFVARERYGDRLPDRWGEFGPDLAVEVLSPSDRPAPVLDKVAQFLGAGTRVVWVIDPIRRAAVVYRSATDVRILREADALDGEDVLPGFSCPLAEVLDPPEE